MVINTHHKFIFVHIPKAAGTSVMNTLEKIEGNKKSWLAKTKHETLTELQQRVPSRNFFSRPTHEKKLDNYFTFCFVRNPWDRMASFYSYLVENKPRTEIETISGFKDFLEKSTQNIEWIQRLYSMKSQLDYFTTPNNLLKVDFLGHFEHLQEDFKSVTTAIGISRQLSHKNKSTNTHNDYRSLYDNDMIEIIATRFTDEINLFGYQFEDPLPTKRFSKSLNIQRTVHDKNC